MTRQEHREPKCGKNNGEMGGKIEKNSGSDLGKLSIFLVPPVIQQIVIPRWLGAMGDQATHDFP